MKIKLLLGLIISAITLAWNGVQFAASYSNEVQNQLTKKVDKINLTSSNQLNKQTKSIIDAASNSKHEKFISLWGNTSQDNLDHCVYVYDIKRGEACNDPSSVTMFIKNRCNQNVKMKYCVQRKNGRWSCRQMAYALPDESTSMQACDSTGRYVTWGRKPGSTMPPDPQ
jgi:hypothetical protein